MRYSIASVVVATIAASCFANAGPLEFSVAGFKIDPLESSSSSPSSPVSPLLMCLPASDGFAPNVNVQIQPYADSIANYISLSKAQFEQLKFKIISEGKKEGAWTVEYTGSSSGNELHFYSRAVSDGKHVFLITAASKVGQWDTVSPTLKKCVDSFQLK